MAIQYAKGHAPQDMDAAKGGLVLDRARNFVKAENDDVHPLGTGLSGPENTQDYSKKGTKDPKANRTGTKALPAIKPRC